MLELPIRQNISNTTNTRPLNRQDLHNNSYFTLAEILLFLNHGQQGGSCSSGPYLELEHVGGVRRVRIRARDFGGSFLARCAARPTNEAALVRGVERQAPERKSPVLSFFNGGARRSTADSGR